MLDAGYWMCELSYVLELYRPLIIKLTHPVSVSDSEHRDLLHTLTRSTSISSIQYLVSDSYTSPCAIIALATLIKPPILAPLT